MPDHWNSLANLLGTPSLAPQNRKTESGGATKSVVPAPVSPAVPPPTEVESEPAPMAAITEPLEVSGKPEKSRLKSSWDAVASFFGVAPSDPESKSESTSDRSAAVPMSEGGALDDGMSSRVPGKKTKPSMWGGVEADAPSASTAPVSGAAADSDRSRGPSRRDSEPRGQERRGQEPRVSDSRGEDAKGADVRGADVKAPRSGERDGRDRDDHSELGIGSDRRSHRRLPRRGRGENPEVEFAPRGSGVDEGIGGKGGFGAEVVGDAVDRDARGSEGPSNRRDSERGRREPRSADREVRGDRDRRGRPEREERDREERDREDVESREERMPSSRRQDDIEPVTDRSASETRRGGRRNDARTDGKSSDSDHRDAAPRDNTDEAPRRGPRSGQPRGGEQRSGERVERTDRGERVERSGSDRGERVERTERGDRDERIGSERGDRPERAERGVRGDRGDRAERGERGRGGRDRDSERTGNDRPKSDRPVVASTRKPMSDRSEGSKSDSPKDGRRGSGGFGAGIHQGSRDEFVGDEFDDRLEPGDDFDEVVEDRDLDDRDRDDRDLEDGAESRDDLVDSEESREKRPRRRRRRGGKDRDRDGAEEASRPRSHRRDEDRDGQQDEVDDDAEEGIRLSKIPSWTETIMVVVESNMANHQRTPQGGRGPSRGRGRR